MNEGAMRRGDVALKAFCFGMKSDGVEFVETASELLPDVLIADPRYGLIGIDIYTDGTGSELTEQEKKAIMSRKKRALRVELGDLDRAVPLKYLRVKVASVTDEELSNPTRLILRKINLSSHELASEADTLILDAIERAKARFNPAFVFVAKPRLPTFEDPSDVAERDSRRFILDVNQASLAESAGSGVSILTGPAGSGKTLVLVARARLLSNKHPTWTIRVVCYNNALKPYLEGLVKDLRNVRVFTFYDLIQENGHSFKMKEASEGIAERQYKGQIHISKSADALLVDEAQDFFAGWLKYMIDTVREDRGGVFLVGDQTQSLYRHTNLAEDVSDYSPKILRLEKPYRSTRQILEFVGALLPEVKIEGSGFAPEGAVPDLVYVPPGSLHARYMAISLALDITRNLKLDSSLKLGDIGVLVTRHFETGAIIGPKVGRLPELLEELMGEPQSITPIFKGFASELNPDENSIKFMTMHSAKGLEFRQVYLVGLEHLDSEKLLKNSLLSNDLGEAALHLIGPTRAKDRLTVYYSKDNVFLKRLADRDELFQLRRYPEDYEVRGEWLS
jgi:hypothetical protein